MSKGRRNVKLSDIAEELHISTVSVSNALNGKRGVSNELRQKIFDTAEEMGYRRSARSVDDKISKQYNIGILIGERYVKQQDISFYMKIYQEIVLAALRKGCMTALEVITEESEEGGKAPELLNGSNADGIIILGDIKESLAMTIREKASIPFVFLDYYDNIPDTDYVISDCYNGMYAVTRVLIKAGYTKIGFVGNVPGSWGVTEKYLGYRKALLESGIKLNDEWILRETKRGENITDIPLPQELPDAFVCNSDITARFLIAELNKKGYKVPEDIGIVGFNDYPSGTADDLRLTTYAVDISAMAQIGVNKLIRKLENTSFVSRLRIVDGNVLIGNSHK